MPLSDTPRISYFPAARRLQPFITGYHLFCVAGTADNPTRDYFWPGWMHLRIIHTLGTTWRLKTRNDDEYHEMGVATVFGPTSGRIATESTAGVVVGAGLTPQGWLRLTDQPAHRWADRVGTPEEAGFPDVTQLSRDVAALEREEDIAGLFDSFFRQHLSPEIPPDPRIDTIFEHLAAPEPLPSAELAETLGMKLRSLQRLSNRAFGFSPSLLMRRARFLRSLAAMRQTDRAHRRHMIDPSYVDYSHFVRDSHFFLGAPPASVLDSESEMAVRSLSVRKEVLGHSVQALIQGGVEPGGSDR